MHELGNDVHLSEDTLGSWDYDKKPGKSLLLAVKSSIPSVPFFFNVAVDTVCTEGNGIHHC